MHLILQEYFKDTVAHNCQNGVRDKMATTKKKTQTGEAKVTGRKTHLDKTALTTQQKADLKASVAEYKKHMFGIRALARKMSATLVLPKVVGIDTAKRMVEEFKVKGLLRKR